jgi:bacteriocin biosynthesis cyclodehydratase domain-containing protein
LTGLHPDGPRSGPAALIAIGDFGAAITAALRPRLQAVAWPASELKAAFSGAAAAVVVAAWRQQQAVCEMADQLAYRFSKPWLPVTMDHPRVRIGPVVVPGTGPCFGCFIARRAQHDAHRTATAALDRAYADDPEAGPRGYLDHHVRLAAALSELLLESLDQNPAGVAGLVVNFNVLQMGVRSHRVIPCSGCPKCRTTPGYRPGSYLETLHARGREP